MSKGLVAKHFWKAVFYIIFAISLMSFLFPVSDLTFFAKEKGKGIQGDYTV